MRKEFAFVLVIMSVFFLNCDQTPVDPDCKGEHCKKTENVVEKTGYAKKVSKSNIDVYCYIEDYIRKVRIVNGNDYIISFLHYSRSGDGNKIIAVHVFLPKMEKMIRLIDISDFFVVHSSKMCIPIALFKGSCS